MQRQPHHHPRRILLAVTGLSPQIITETLYALTQTEQPPFIPTEIRIITTAEGAERIRLALLPQGRDWLGRLRRDYQLPPIAFDMDHIHILHDANDNPLNDIRDIDDNRQAADLITNVVRDLSADPDSALHASIAGGRKTMGFYLGYALSLYGRPQDRLSHILVSAPYESSWDFFYPTPPAANADPIATRDGSLIDPAKAQVALAPIPFVPLRHGLPQALLDGKQSYTDSYQAAVDAARLALAPPQLHIHLARQQVNAAGIDIPLTPVEISFYAWLAQRCINGQPAPSCPKDGVPDPDHARAFLTIHQQVIGEMGDLDRTAAALASGMDKNYFERRKTGINKKLKQTLGHAASAYLISHFGQPPHRTHGLDLPPAAITIG